MDEADLCGYEGPGGAVCMRPKDHAEENHMWSVELPPDVAQIIENHITMMDEQEKRNDRVHRKMRFATKFLYGAIGVYIVLIIAELIDAVISTPS